MTREEDWGEDCFYCNTCGKRFRSPLYDVGKEFAQTFFYKEPRPPEIEVMGAETIANYCSPACRGRSRDQLLLQDKVRATFPGIGPVETCSRCGGLVDMTKFHLTYVQTDTTQDWGRPMFGVGVLRTETLAVICQECEPIPRRIAAAISWDQ